MGVYLVIILAVIRPAAAVLAAPLQLLEVLLEQLLRPLVGLCSTSHASSSHRPQPLSYFRA